MKPAIKQGLRRLVVAVMFVLGAHGANAQNSDARAIVIDSNGEIYRANFFCEAPDCTQELVSLTDATVKAASSVAIGTITTARPTNYAAAANTGKKGKITLLVEETVGQKWIGHPFDSDNGATALLFTRNDGTLYVAREGGLVEQYERGADGTGVGGQGYDNTEADASFAVSFEDSTTCTKITALEEWPRNSGNLLVVCNAPAGVLAVEVADGAISNVEDISPPNSLGASLAGGGVNTILVSGENTDFAMIIAEPKEILAIDLSGAPYPVQRNLFDATGDLRDLSTSLCFKNKDTDGDTDVDEACLLYLQSGGDGATSILSVEHDPVLDQLIATVEDQIDNQGNLLKNPYAATIENIGTFSIDGCDDGCQVANHIYTSFLANGDGSTGSFETQGPFLDTRFDSISGLCARIPLPLAYLGIPVLEAYTVGSEFCALNGTFFVDIVSAPGVTPTEGFIQIKSPGECWMPGSGESMAGGAPAVSLDNVEYGLLAGDEFDLLRVDGTNVPPAIGDLGDDTKFVSNEFVQDTLVGCSSRERVDGRYTFILEDFIGSGLDSDLMGKNDPIGAGNILFDYGSREANQRISDVIDSPQSGCNEELLSGPLSGACESHVVALNGGLAGWELQQFVGASAVTIVADDLTAISGATEAAVPLSGLGGLNLGITASAGTTFDFKNTASGSVMGLAPGTNGQIDIGQSLTFAVSTTPRPGDAVVSDGMGGKEAVEVDVPFLLDSITIAELNDGPEGGSVEEKMLFTATLADGGVCHATLENLFAGVSDFAWNLVSEPGCPLTSTPAVLVVIASDTVRVDDPFGVAIVSLEIEAVAGSCGTGSCTSQSAGSLFDIAVEPVDRIEALSFAYQDYLRALCSVSTRPNYDGSGGTRPKICTDESIPSVPAAFNEVGGVSSGRNIAGYQQADLESVLRFISHNICELDFDTGINPGNIVFTGTDSFCTVRPEWAPPPAP